jgi:two-component system cell cycle sensor histidine kinase/response regulator CckA
MIHRLIGEDIKLTWLPGSAVWPVRFDPSQIDQIITNLCLNAQDAVSNGGEIIIKTENSVIDMNISQTLPGISPGDYTLITVNDNGCGIPKSVLRHIFEPFFTTKKVGEGTGLGLATVYGILKQNKGYINAKSTPGHGATFEIFLPRHDGHVEIESDQKGEKNLGSGQETVLLVEDEPAILTLVSTMLRKQGYHVLSAAAPGEAIRIAENNSGDIHLILTDIVMPEMNGRDLAKRILSLYPDLKCLFMSGYTADVIAHQDMEEDCSNFIQKPFAKAHLLTIISQILK